MGRPAVVVLASFEYWEMQSEPVGHIYRVMYL
jgi:hypothetical protein